MTFHEQGFDGSTVFAGAQLLVPSPPLDIVGSVNIRVSRIPTGLTAKRLLIRPILAVGIVTHAALLG
jgi:hypothetical protein